MKNENKIKYDSEYISYVEHGDSAAVFIVRDLVKNIDTSKMWIDIIKTWGEKNEFGVWDFVKIKIELFPRKINPSTSSAILIINVIFPGVVGIMALKTTAIPVTPPKEKLFGNLNTYTPTTRISVATVSTKYSSIVRFTRPAFLNIVFSSV